MREPRANRTARWVCAILAGVIFIGAGLLCVRLRVYWVAKYRGTMADLRGATLFYAPLRGANLAGAKLQFAHLTGANLAGANLNGASLRGADLRGADLRGATAEVVSFEKADLRGADLRGMQMFAGFFEGALYNPSTRWPAGFDPKQQGAILVK